MDLFTDDNIFVTLERVKLLNLFILIVKVGSHIFIQVLLTVFIFKIPNVYIKKGNGC